jgi:hypothetical protein
MTPEKFRIRNLSTRYLAVYKNSVPVVMIMLMGSYFGYGYFEYKRDGHISQLLMPLNFSYLFYIWWLVNRKIYHVEFDQDFLYVIQKNQDLIIPLENIKDVNLVSMGGVYKVELYTKELFGDTFYFKPSLLYPFNHKKKEALVDVLWANIEKAKSKKQDFQRNALHS